jgi:transcription-repair coupling factor (superfamily II helicase)
VSDLGVRLGLYRRLATLVDPADIEGFAAELVDRFGPIPEEVENLLQVIAIKRLSREAGVERIEAGPKGAVLAFRNNRFAKPDALLGFINDHRTEVNLRPDHRLVFRRSWANPKTRVTGVRQLMQGALAR